MKQIIYAVPLVAEGQVSKPIKYQVQGLCPEYPGPQSARVFEEEIEKRGKDKVLRPHVNSTQQKEPSKIKENVNLVKSSNSEKRISLVSFAYTKYYIDYNSKVVSIRLFHK